MPLVAIARNCSSPPGLLSILPKHLHQRLQARACCRSAVQVFERLVWIIWVLHPKLLLGKRERGDIYLLQRLSDILCENVPGYRSRRYARLFAEGIVLNKYPCHALLHYFVLRGARCPRIVGQRVEPLQQGERRLFPIRGKRCYMAGTWLCGPKLLTFARRWITIVSTHRSRVLNG